MRYSWKAGIYPFVAAGYGGAGVYAGSLRDVPMRDWHSLLALVLLLAGFFALLALGPRDKELEYAARRLECGMTGADEEHGETARNGVEQGGTTASSG